MMRLSDVSILLTNHLSDDTETVLIIVESQGTKLLMILPEKTCSISEIQVTILLSPPIDILKKQFSTG